MNSHIVCVYQGGRHEVVGRYASEGEAARAMRALGPTAHVVLDGELVREHPSMTEGMRRGIDRALVAGTHPALPLARYAAPAPAPAPEAPPPEAPAEPSLEEVARLVEVALRTAGTQLVLARALGVSEATVCRAARGTRRVNAAFIDALRAYVERHPAPPAPAPEGAAALFKQAVDQAGSIHLLAAAIGRDPSGIFRARAQDSYSPALVEAMRAYVEGPARVEAPAEPTADEEPEGALAPEVEAPRAAPVEAEAKQPAPRVLHVPARAPAGADSAVTLRLEREDAARLYRLLAGSGEQVLRLALADALLGAA